MDVKIFKYNDFVDKRDIESVFSFVGYCCFFENVKMVAIPFVMDKMIRVTIMEKASELGLEPISVTRKTFLDMLNALQSSQIKITAISFSDEIEAEDKKELNSLLISKSKDIYGFVKDILKRYETFINHIDWYDAKTEINKMVLFNSGILMADNRIDSNEHSYLNILSSL